MELPAIHLRQGGSDQVRVLGGGQERSKGCVGSNSHSWYVSEAGVQWLGHP